MFQIFLQQMRNPLNDTIAFKETVKTQIADLEREIAANADANEATKNKMAHDLRNLRRRLADQDKGIVQQRRWISEAERGQFGGLEATTTLHQTLIGPDRPGMREDGRALNYISETDEFMQNAMTAGDITAQLERIRQNSGGHFIQPVIHGNGVHFTIYEPKARGGETKQETKQETK